MSKHCEDCGTRLERSGACQNCHEALVISERFADEIRELEREGRPQSAEWWETVAQQEQEVTKRQRKAGGEK